MSNFILLDEALINKVNMYPRNQIFDFIYSIYLSKLGPKNKLSKDQLIKSLTKSKIKTLLSYCPMCNNVVMFIAINCKNDELKSAKYCPVCKNIHFINKNEDSLERLSNFIKISHSLPQTNTFQIKLIRQQFIVMLATQLEIFLRDFYSSILNMRNIQHQKTCYNKFYKECKNDFINMGKSNSRLKKELSIDLKELIGKKSFTTLNYLYSYRNNIVHNNGFADNNLISQTGKPFLLGDEINICETDIKSYVATHNCLIEKLINIYSLEFNQVVINRLNFNYPTIIYNSVLTGVGFAFTPVRKLFKG